MRKSQDEWDIIIGAAHAARLIRHYHGSSEPAAKKIDELVDMIRGEAQALPYVSEQQKIRVNRIALAFAEVLNEHLGTRRKLPPVN